VVGLDAAWDLDQGRDEVVDEASGEPGGDDLGGAPVSSEVMLAQEAGRARLRGWPVTSESTSAGQMRIEMQTGDPDVRIIWFAAENRTPAVEN
jgi:hypothetical protein